MNNFLINWKTSFFGILSIGFGLLIGFRSNDWITASPFFVSGLGLLSAKDSNKQ